MKKFILSLALIGGLAITPAAAQGGQYADVPSNYWAADAIYELTDEGVLSGYSDSTYKPKQAVTREEAAVILARAAGLNTEKASALNFADVSTKSSAYEEIAAVTDAGIFIKREKFYPQRTLTRGEVAMIVAKAFDLPQAAGSSSFKDAPASHYAHDYIQAVAKAGIMEGATATTFDPEGSVSRAFFAVVVDRAMEYTPQAAAPVSAKAEATATQQEVPVEQAAATLTEIQKTIKLVNEERAKVGAPLLAEDPELSRIAQLKAEDMANNQYFDHYSPTYGNPFKMAYDQGYSYQMYGENLAVGQTSAPEVVTDWMNSQSHRDNLLTSGYRNIGVGYAKDADGTVYWTHLFSLK